MHVGLFLQRVGQTWSDTVGNIGLMASSVDRTQYCISCLFDLVEARLTHPSCRTCISGQSKRPSMRLAPCEPRAVFGDYIASSLWCRLSATPFEGYFTFTIILDNPVYRKSRQSMQPI